MSIYEKISEQLSTLEDQFEQNISAPGKDLQSIRETLNDESLIHKFSGDSNGSDGWLAAIDGGTAIEKLSTGDLIMSGSTVAGGSYRQPFFPENEDLAEVWFAIRPHINSNEEMLSIARAVQEIRVFAKTSHERFNSFGVRVIDGAWLGNVSTVLYGFLSKDNCAELLSMNDYDRDGLLASGLEELLTVDPQNPLTAVALTKSDSDRSYVSRWSNRKDGEFIIDPDNAKNYTDRFVTSYVLEPGEFVQPRHVMYNENLYRRLLDADSHLEKVLTGARDRKRMAEALRKYNELMRDMNDRMKLWTTYFKPSEFDSYSKSLKIEFVFDGGSLQGSELDSAVVEYAKKAIETVNSDIHSNAVLEPMCQYNVDREAKQVSGAMKLALNHLSSKVSEEDALRNLVRGYRT